jgi:MFS family permease
MEEIGPTPLPLKTLIVLCVVILSEPMSMSILFPFVVYMVRDFDIAEEKDIGYYVGFIASSFSLAQLLTAIAWGRLSDRFGRRAILLIGLLGNSITMLFFGLSKSLQWAIMSRALCGFLNGNIGVAKSAASEISDKTNRGTVFGIFGGCYGIGMIFGPAIGGLLQNPVNNGYIQSEFLAYYPYFLPCAFSAAISLFGFIVGLIYLPKSFKTEYSTITDCDIVNDQDHSLSIDVSTNEILPAVNESTLLLPQNISIGNSKLTAESIYASAGYAILALQNIVFMEAYPLWASNLLKLTS